MKTQIKQLLYGILATSCFGLSCTSCTLGPKEYRWPPKDGEPTVTLLGPVYETGSETKAPLFKALEQAMTAIVEHQQTHLPEFYQQRIAGMNHQLFRPGYSNEEEWGSIKSLSNKAENYDLERMAGILESSENRKPGLEMAIRIQPTSNQNPALVTLEGYRLVLQPSGKGQAEWFTQEVKLTGRKAGEAFRNALIGELSRPFTYSPYSAVSAGHSYTCAVLSRGTVKCWGSGSSGQLGNGSTSTQSTPVSVSDISTATSVSAGVHHTCAVLSGGTVKCWGYGNYGQLGNGSTSTQLTPVSVSSISTATSVSAGDYHTCAVLFGGTVKCWGYGGDGQLGNGATSIQTTPVSVSSISTAASVSAGSYNTCAVLSGGTVKCWGRGSSGQLGNGSITSDQSTPVSVSGISTATSVSAGDYHTCAVLSGGTVKCWGTGYYGQLGNGSSGNQWEHQTTPVEVLGI